MTAGIVDRVNAWFAEAARPLPWRGADVTPWGVLVSEFMLQQTQASRVEPKWLEFMARWPDAEALARATDADVLRAWDRLGYPRRARWLRACAIAIVEWHGGRVPADEASLRALPGVGPYTAAAVACFAHGMPTAVVDTNVRRVIARAVVGTAEAWAPSAARDEAEYRALVPLPGLPDAGTAAAVGMSTDAGSIAFAGTRTGTGARTASATATSTATARRRATTWNAAAMELGALVCTSRSPACDRCPIEDACAWRQAGAPVRTVAGTPRRTQAPYAGSDREMRGRILAELRTARGGIAEPTLRARATETAPDARANAARYERSLRGLAADGLIERDGDRIKLPGD